MIGAGSASTAEMVDLVIVQPEIPQNTGNAMRLAANTGARLHLIEPLAFSMDDTKLRRAGMDYRDRAQVFVHSDIESWRADTKPKRVFALSGQGPIRFTEVEFQTRDALLFGTESVGLSTEILGADWVDAVLHIPMVAGVRSLNLSNAIAVVAYHAWYQLGFAGAK